MDIASCCCETYNQKQNAGSVIGNISIYTLTSNVSVVTNSKIKVSLILVILVGGSLRYLIMVLIRMPLTD